MDPPLLVCTCNTRVQWMPVGGEFQSYSVPGRIVASAQLKGWMTILTFNDQETTLEFSTQPMTTKLPRFSACRSQDYNSGV